MMTKPRHHRHLPDAPRTVQQAAEELNLAAGTVRLWIAERRIGYVRLGRSIRIPKKEIERLLTRGFVPARERIVPRHPMLVQKKEKSR